MNYYYPHIKMNSSCTAAHMIINYILQKKNASNGIMWVEYKTENKTIYNKINNNKNIWNTIQNVLCMLWNNIIGIISGTKVKYTYVYALLFKTLDW